MELEKLNIVGMGVLELVVDEWQLNNFENK